MNNWIAAVFNVFNRPEPAVFVPDSPYHHLHYADEHFHSVCDVYPSLVPGIDVTAGAAGPPWVLGAFTEIVPASAITNEFDIHYVSVEGMDTNDVYELHLFWGAGDTLAGKRRFTKTAVMDGVQNVPFQTKVIPANSRIRAKLASAAGGSIARISIGHHPY